MSLASGTDLPGLLQAPLRVLHLVGERFWRHVLFDRRSFAGAFESGMNSHQLQVVIQMDGRVGGLQPQLLAYQPERR
jgi:hypothetical protein